jgi:DNA-binding CsgD family transcriptional regulator
VAYDPEDLIARMRGDAESDWPARLLGHLALAPLVPEWDISRHMKASARHVPTPAELRALEATSYGLTSEMVGDLLGISPETVKRQLSSARYRLRAKNTTHACCEALRRGLIR